MDEAGGGTQARRLRSVDGEAISDPAVLEGAIAACVGRGGGGIVARSLAGAVADHLGVPPSAISPRGLSTALGLMIATGRLDEVAGRLVAVGQEERRAG